MYNINGIQFENLQKLLLVFVNYNKKLNLLVREQNFTGIKEK